MTLENLYCVYVICLISTIAILVRSKPKIILTEIDFNMYCVEQYRHV